MLSAQRRRLLEGGESLQHALPAKPVHSLGCGPGQQLGRGAHCTGEQGVVISRAASRSVQLPERLHSSVLLSEGRVRTLPLTEDDSGLATVCLFVFLFKF